MTAKRGPFLVLLKLAAWAGAGYATSRAFPRKASPVDGAESRGPAQKPSTSFAGDAGAPNTGARGTNTGARSTSNLEETNSDGDLESLWIPGVGGSLHLLRSTQDSIDSPHRLPVLFIHGLGGSVEQWRGVLSHLHPTVPGVALDLPGHGQSDPHGGDGEALTMDDLSAAIGAVADGLGWRRFLLVGHSLGAAVAIHYAGRQSPRAAGLLLVDPNGDQSRIPADERRAALESVERDAHEELGWHFRQLLNESEPETRERVLEDLTATDADTLCQTLSASLDYSPLADLDAYAKSLQGPTRCMLSPINDLPYSLHRLRPELQVAIFRGAGHWIMLDDPDALLELLGPFFEAVQPQIH